MQSFFVGPLVLSIFRRFMSASEIPASFQRRPANGKRISAFATPSLARVLFCPRRTFEGQDVHLKPQLMSRMQDASFPPVEVLYASVDSPKFACDRSSYLFVGSFDGPINSPS